MSILFTCDDGWIISHIDYLHKIYKTVNDNSENKSLKFNESLFKVNSLYLRQNQIKNQNKNEEDLSFSRKRKRKKTETLSKDILEQNNFVKEISTKILNNVERLKIFTNVIEDNNAESRLESKKFFLDTAQTNSNFHGSNQRELAIVTDFQNKKYVFPKYSTFYCYDIREINEKFQGTDQFDLILLDPPWWNKSIRRKKMKFEESSYKMMYNNELAKIPIKKLLSSDGIVAVWCTNAPSHIKSILEEIFPAWSVNFKAKWYWLKITQNGKTICDFNEVHGKQPYEQLIFGAVSTNANFDIPDKKIIISTPSSVHSHKPPLTEVLKPYLPENPKSLEIFARYLLPEWTSWGLEVLKFQHLSLYTEIKSETAPEDSNVKR